MERPTSRPRALRRLARRPRRPRRARVARRGRTALARRADAPSGPAEDLGPPRVRRARRAGLAAARPRVGCLLARHPGPRRRGRRGRASDRRRISSGGRGPARAAQRDGLASRCSTATTRCSWRRRRRRIRSGWLPRSAAGCRRSPPRAGASCSPICRREAIEIAYAGRPLVTPTGVDLGGLPDLLGLLARARDDGFAENVEETALGLHCLAVPVRNGRGRALAAMTVCVPTGRIDPARREVLLTDLRATAARLERDVAWLPTRDAAGASNRHRPTRERV